MRSFKKAAVFILLNLAASMLMQFVLTGPVQHRIRYEEFKRGD